MLCYLFATLFFLTTSYYLDRFVVRKYIEYEFNKMF